MKKFLKGIAIGAAGVGFAASAYKTVMTKKRMEPYQDKLVFKGESISFDGQIFQYASYAAAFTGLSIDFTGADLQGNIGRLDLFGDSSGIQVIVPDNWCVEAKGLARASGVNNSVESEAKVNQPVLYIHYDLRMSGLDISYNKADDEDEEEVEMIEE
ncbi:MULTISPECIES: hypothetical protein [unclassified Fusibacter]|uniref:hypothetical protein n=1 Tax=unclassified Fusibacter TaxID=2624464 RepID=UPI00101290DA|nr:MULTISPECIES: hypothetical protein [unclassified Fusibacter]MCK8058652.1 hypothetical protein [Fusibacter sp. A2]NPE21727.1 hypothetical protein [Fusibacter sp. A1]RXV61301.1 hypothetical protein DWB64_07770 [Fusibacter sp. A1]